MAPGAPIPLLEQGDHGQPHEHHHTHQLVGQGHAEPHLAKVGEAVTSRSAPRHGRAPSWSVNQVVEPFSCSGRLLGQAGQLPVSGVEGEPEAQKR